MNATNEKKALGRGLSSLLPRKIDSAGPIAAPMANPRSAPLDQIDPNPSQPRTEFHPAALQELADSIRAHGIIQPLIVRRKGERYDLVAGERRWRAARMAGLSEVPIAVQEVPDAELLEIALIENIQREDLNPIEVASALERLQQEFALSHEDLASRTGKDRSTITNLLRLLKLPKEVQFLLSERRLSLGHAKVILGLPTDELQRDVAHQIVAQGLSVRNVERLVKRMLEPREAEEAPEKLDPNVQAAIEELERTLGTRVRILQKGDARGRIEIEYYSQDDLDRIYDHIVRPNS